MFIMSVYLVYAHLKTTLFFVSGTEVCILPSLYGWLLSMVLPLSQVVSIMSGLYKCSLMAHT